MTFFKPVLYSLLITSTLFLYVCGLYQNIAFAIKKNSLEVQIKFLESKKSTMELNVQGLTRDIFDKIAEDQEIQASLVDLVTLAQTQRLELFIFGVFSVGCVIIFILTSNNSSPDLSTSASLGNLIDSGQTSYINLLTKHIETTQAITALTFKSRQTNNSIEGLMEAVTCLKCEIAALSLEITSDKNKLQGLLNFFQSG
jgi:peptidoglycan hydrolase CwlO-like protein